MAARKTKADLQRENDELRERVGKLERLVEQLAAQVVDKLVAAPPIFVPVPCPCACPHPLAAPRPLQPWPRPQPIPMIPAPLPIVPSPPTNPFFPPSPYTPIWQPMPWQPMPEIICRDNGSSVTSYSSSFAVN
jgi:hypothetical protein